MAYRKRRSFKGRGSHYNRGSRRYSKRKRSYAKQRSQPRTFRSIGFRM